eukprot:scpid79839/ scgid35260/ Methylated-DNA--protein-cysteine methyltransferase; 6-O-methylguanine-DNA methyltransferase; O-6-methylguanine-DNA-alkyltransferase
MCSLSYRCPFGVLEITASVQGLLKVSCKPVEVTSTCSGIGTAELAVLGTAITNVAAVEDESCTCSCGSAYTSCKAKDVLLAASSWLRAYFCGDLAQMGPVPPLDLTAMPEFTAQVLRELTACTEPGVTITYGALGRRLGREKAGRAVGNAMRTNPIPLFVPCHRVTLGNGSLGNYSMGHGTLTKEWLLEHEKKMSKT